MNTAGDSADKMVGAGIDIVEHSIKLCAAGAKNMAAIAVALAQNNPQRKGITTMNRILQENRELTVIPLRRKDLSEFKKRAKRYGILFTAIREKNEKDTIQIMAKAEDCSKLNRVFESMGYAVPKEEVKTRKKSPTREASKSESMLQRAGAEKMGRETSSEKVSVRDKIRKLQVEALTKKVIEHAVGKDVKERT